MNSYASRAGAYAPFVMLALGLLAVLAAVLAISAPAPVSGQDSNPIHVTGLSYQQAPYTETTPSPPTVLGVQEVNDPSVLAATGANDGTGAWFVIAMASVLLGGSVLMFERRRRLAKLES